VAQIHGLGQVVERPGLQGFHRIFGRAEGRDHHDALTPAGRVEPHQQLQARPVGQTHVGHHRMKGARLKQLPRLGQAGGALDVIAFPHQRELVKGEQVGLVVHDEHAVPLGLVQLSPTSEPDRPAGRRITITNTLQ
jgi:hypothetical protein